MFCLKDATKFSNSYLCNANFACSKYSTQDKCFKAIKMLTEFENSTEEAEVACEHLNFSPQKKMSGMFES